MKFTKLMALALVLLMTVAVFAACGGQSDVTTPEETTPEVTTPEATEPDETEPEVTEPDETEPDATEPEVTEPEETEPETTVSTCKHANKKTGNNKDATCTEEGYIEYKCTKCDLLSYKPVEKLAHTYGEFKSVDGQYTKKVCAVCKDSYVLDGEGNTVADASAIVFPAFAATFDGVETIDDAAKLFDGFALVPTFVSIVHDPVTGEIYLNIPAGDARTNPNGCLDLVDQNVQFVGTAFTLTFDVRFEETPVENTALLTWTVGDKAQVILQAAKGGRYLDAEGNPVAVSPRKAWDSFKVEFAADGSYTVYLFENDEYRQIHTGTVVTEGASSTIRFLDNKNQFEAYLDSIIITK